MKKFALQYTLLLLLLVLVFSAVTTLLPLNKTPELSQEQSPPKRFNVQVVLKARAKPPDFWRIVEMGLKMAAEEFSVEYEVNGPETESQIDIQIDMVQKAIAKRPDALILAAGEYERLVPVCQQAVEAGVKLIILDSDVNYTGKTCFISTDNYELGTKIGRLVDDLLQPEQRFGVVSHVESSSTAIERRRGLLSVIPENTKRMAGFTYCNGSVEEAHKQTLEMMRQFPDITCMVGLNETSALGICSALEELGLAGTVKVIACDSSEAQIKYMENGTIQAFVIQNPFNMGYLSMQAAVQVLEGKTVQPLIHTASVTITKEEMYRPEHQKLLFPFTE